MTEARPTSRALRARFEEEYVLPLARALFDLEPRCQSVLFTVGQYWCDEAADAVHHEVVLCDTREPSWPDSGQLRSGVIGCPEVVQHMLSYQTTSDEEPWDLVDVQSALVEQARYVAFGGDRGCPLDDNNDMIVAFASYCSFVGDQEQPTWRSHVPYCIVRRPGPGEAASLDVIGKCHRPQWEDRWDVLEPGRLISDIAEEEVASGRSPMSAMNQSKQPAKRARSRIMTITIATVFALLLVRGCLHQGG
jgi:hypothetical protein